MKDGNDGTFLSEAEMEDQSEATFLEISGRLRLEPTKYVCMFVRCINALTSIVVESVLEEQCIR